MVLVVKVATKHIVSNIADVCLVNQNLKRKKKNCFLFPSALKNPHQNMKNKLEVTNGDGCDSTSVTRCVHSRSIAHGLVQAGILTSLTQFRQPIRSELLL